MVTTSNVNRMLPQQRLLACIQIAWPLATLRKVGVQPSSPGVLLHPAVHTGPVTPSHRLAMLLSWSQQRRAQTAAQHSTGEIVKTGSVCGGPKGHSQKACIQGTDDIHRSVQRPESQEHGAAKTNHRYSTPCYCSRHPPQCTQQQHSHKSHFKIRKKNITLTSNKLVSPSTP
jgi:hypothetical protein